ncbi:MAG TPA: GGDEF domain-containing protein [Pirellulales bacterium]|nr:GGDEF domain-containing protein [Pirellulales bacterium]
MDLPAVITLSVFTTLVGFALGTWVARRILSKNAVSSTPPTFEESMKRFHTAATELGTLMSESTVQFKSVEQSMTRESNLQTRVLESLDQITRLQTALSEAETRIREQSQRIEFHVAESRIDALTTLANRRALDEELGRRFSEAKRTHHPFSVMLVDVDHFKRINDTHGHQAGDEVLRKVAATLQTTMREMDLVARYGGEEFAIVLPATDLLSSIYAAERVLRSLEQARFEVDGTTLAVTVSIGIAAIRTEETLSMLLRRTDDALYCAKASGRNRAFLHDGRESRPINAPKHLLGGELFKNASSDTDDSESDEPAVTVWG